MKKIFFALIFSAPLIAASDSNVMSPVIFSSSGGGTPSFPLLASDGTGSAPSYSFSSDTDTGMYLFDFNKIGFGWSGSHQYYFGNIGFGYHGFGRGTAIFGSLSAIDSYVDTFFINGHVFSSGSAGTKINGGYQVTAQPIAVFPWKATATNRVYMAYGADETEPSVSSGTITVKSGTPLTLETTNRGVDLATGGTKPTCDSSVRGQVFNEEGGSGVADVLYMCMKNTLDAYSWQAIHTAI